jgi:hypothetical protein
MEHFLSQQGVDIFLLSETFHNPGQAFWLCQFCLPPHRQTDSMGGTAILIRIDIVHHSVPVPGLTQLEATAIQVTLAVKPVRIHAA